MEKKWMMIASFASFILLLSFASARISFTEPNDVYNVGDKLYINLLIAPGSVFGNFEINLVCKDSMNVYRVPAEPSFSVGVEQKISTFVVLSPELVKENLGNCHIEVSIGDEAVNSKDFTITDLIIVKADLDNENYNPGDKVTINVNATKANGQQLEGFLEASGPVSFSRAVQKGKLTEIFTMPKNSSAGMYSLNVVVYDRGINNSILNKGESKISFKINQIPSLIQTSLSSSSINPGDDLSFTSDLYDQSGQKMSGVIQIIVTSPTGKETKFSLNSGSTGSINFMTNETSGQWKIYSSLENVFDSSEFTINKVPRINFEFLENGVLLVKNIGNDIYNQETNVSIGNLTQNISIILDIGEEKKFYLQAPDGEYSVSAGGLSKNMLLTGNAIAIGDSSGFSIWTIVWYFAAGLLLVGMFLFLFGRVKKNGISEESYHEPRARQVNIKPSQEKKAVAPISAPAKVNVGSNHVRAQGYLSRHESNSNATSKPAEKREIVQDKIVKQPTRSFSLPSQSSKGSFIDVRRTNISEAEGSLVMKGQKTNSSIIAVKISNSHSLGAAKHEVEKILTIAREKKGVIDWRDNHVLIVFCPLITRTNENEPIAAKVAFDIFNELKSYNKRFSEKINFNIGLNSGELIAAIEDGKLKYTSIGNTILLAKKIADLSTEKVLVSDNFRNKIMRDIRGEKFGEINKINVFSVISLQDKEANKAKLDDLLKRIGR